MRSKNEGGVLQLEGVPQLGGIRYDENKEKIPKNPGFNAMLSW